jgi:nucleotidyltransferase substrate binding protein (TIGR01987 family)
MVSLDLGSLQRAIEALDQGLGVIDDHQADARRNQAERDTLRAGVVQAFEFTYELCWKFMQRYLETEVGHAAVDGVPRRELFRIAAQQGLTADTQAWFDFHLARNRTAHTYNAQVAAEVVAVARRLDVAAHGLLDELRRRNA